MIKYLLPATCTLLVCSAALAQSTVTLTVNGTSDGTTPRIVGYNLHGLPRPDQATWMRHSEMNGARNWLDADLLFEDQGPPAPVASATQFIQRRMYTRTEINDSVLGNGSAADCGALLSGTTPSAYVDWAAVFSAWDGSGNVETIDEQVRSGGEPMLSLTLSKSRAPLRTDTSDPAYWQDRWLLWRNVFTHAYYAAARWEAATWLFYNEPNSDTAGVTKLEFFERLRLASDAVQLAVKTINKRRTYCGDPLLSAKIVAPATLGHSQLYTSSTTDGWLNGPDPVGSSSYFCDPAIVDDVSGSCWGRSVLQHRVTNNFYGWSLAAADSFSTLFHTYAFQKYEGLDSARYQMQDVWTYLLNYPGGAPLMEVALTETNIDRKGSWPAGTTADTPSQFSGLAEMLIHDAYTDLGISGAEPNKSIYIAKFQQDADDPKGCFHMGASNQVGGATMLAEVVRLFAKGFSGALPRYAVSSSNSLVKSVASYDAAKSLYYVMISNRSTSSFTASLNANALSFLSPFVMAETVSPERRGNASIMTIGSRTFSLTVPAQSATLLTIPTPGTRFSITTPTEDATVKGGINRFTNYGTSSNLWAAGSTSSAAGRNVSYLRFELPTSVDFDDVFFAVLDVYGQAKTTDGTIGSNAIAHVYGIDDETWTEAGVKGYNAPNLAYEDTPTTRIADNFVTGVGTSAELVGHLTGRATAGHFGTDVTRWLKEQPDRNVSFMVTREVRFDPGAATLDQEDTMTDATRSLWFASSEDSDSSRRPRLLIYMR